MNHFECQKRFFDYGFYKPGRVIYIGSDMENNDNSEIDQTTTERFIKALYLLEDESDKPILIKMLTNGGEFEHCMAIYDTIKASKCPIVIEGIGCVRSAGSIILQAADTRVFYKHTRLMVHDGYFGVEGASRQALAWAEEEKNYTLPLIYEIYYDALKEKYFSGVKRYKAIKEIQGWCATDTIFGAEECLSMGFIDDIL